MLFGPDALGYRLADSEARVAVVDASVAGAVADALEACPDLEHVVVVGDGGAKAAADDVAREEAGANGSSTEIHPFADVLDGYAAERDLAETDVDTPATVIYTSGSTGPPKGVLHSHGVWLGHCPAFAMYFERDVFESVYWTPADWAWIGALGDLLFPAWHYGQPVVGYPMEGFDATEAFSILESFDVTDAFLPPTAIRMLMEVDEPTAAYDLALEAICSGGEPLTPEILEWADDALDGVVVNAFAQPASGVDGDADLREAIRSLVWENLAKYEYPREIAFVDSLPQTTTGKIMRRKLLEDGS